MPSCHPWVGQAAPFTGISFGTCPSSSSSSPQPCPWGWKSDPSWSLWWVPPQAIGEKMPPSPWCYPPAHWQPQQRKRGLDGPWRLTTHLPITLSPSWSGAHHCGAECGGGALSAPALASHKGLRARGHRLSPAQRTLKAGSSETPEETRWWKNCPPPFPSPHPPELPLFFSMPSSYC